MRTALVAAALLLGGTALADASSLDKAVDQAISCREIAEEAARLACLDEAVAGLAAAKGRVAEDRAEEKAKKEKKKLADFGLRGDDKDGGDLIARTPEEFGGETVPEVREAMEAKRLKEITGTATSIKLNALKVATLYLDNGQVWRQLESDSITIPHISAKKSYGVTIKRGAMGNYMATIEGLPRSIRVTRVK